MSTDSFLNSDGNPRRVTRDEPYPVGPGGSWTVARVALTDTTQQELVAAGGAGTNIYVAGMFGSNAGASLSTVDLKEATTAKFTFSMSANGGGFACPLTACWKLPANTALNVQQSAAVASYVTVVYRVE